MNYLAKEALSACSVWNAIVGRHTWIPASGTGHHGAPVRHFCVHLIIYRALSQFPALQVGLWRRSLWYSPLPSLLPVKKHLWPLFLVCFVKK